MSLIPRPDHSTRPLQMTCESVIHAKPSVVFAAWTEKLDAWFAQPGSLCIVPEPGQPYFFYNKDEWGRHPHYGRFLAVKQDQLIEMTWLTGNGAAEGTEGAETILKIELTPKGEATEVRLSHSGFTSEQSCTGHKENWPLALEILDETLSNQATSGPS